jgi:Cu/Ag efflux pump CusA
MEILSRHSRARDARHEVICPGWLGLTTHCPYKQVTHTIRRIDEGPIPTPDSISTAPTVIHQLLALALKFRVMVVGGSAVIMALAASQLPTAPAQTLPEFGPTQVEVQVEALGLSAAEVEQLITIPMEHLLGGVAWVDQIESESVPGLSTIDLIFKPGTPLLKARQVTLERLGRADTLPNVGSPPVMIQPLSSESRVMMVGLTSTQLSLVDLSILARWRIKPRLMGVPGVANVAIWGFRDRQLQVQVDPDRLRKNGVTLSQIINSTGNALWVSPLTFIAASTPGTGGFIDTSTQRFTIQHVLPITTPNDLSSVIIEGTGSRLRLGQVTTVVEDHQPLIGDALMSDGNPGLMLVIQKFPGASTAEVTARVQDALNDMQPGLPNVAYDTSIFQPLAYVQKALQNLGLALLGGLVLLFVGLLLLVSWRVAIIATLTTAFSMLAATYALYLTGSSLNLLVLAGLGVALGIVISDGVIDACNIARRLREQRWAGSAPAGLLSTVVEASSSTRGPLGYATVILLIAPLPLLFLDGVAGAFARPAVIAYELAVLLSMVIAMTVTPALSFLLLKNERLSARPGPFGRLASRVFDNTVLQFLFKPRLAFAVLAVMVLAIFAVIPQLSSRPSVPLPQDRTLMVSLETSPGTSLKEMERVTAQAIRDVRAVPGVRQATATIGRAITGDRTLDVNSADLWVNLTDSADYKTTVAGVERALQRYPGLRSQAMTYSEGRLRAVQAASNTALAGTQSSIVVRVYGKDLTVLRAKAEQVRQRISQVQGIAGAKVQSQMLEPTLEVQVDLAAAQRYGLNPGDVRRAATTYYAGLLVGNIYDDQKVVDVIVQGTPKTQANTNIADLLVDTPTGSLVRLGDVATVRMMTFPMFIKHDAASRSLDVTADVAGRDLGSVLTDVKLQVLTVQMPTEYHAEVFSDLATEQNRVLRIGLLVAGALIAIFLLLQAALGSWRMAGMVLVSLPLACAGAVLAAFLVGGVTNLGAALGLFAAFGIAVREIVLLMRRYQEHESVEGPSRRMDVVIRATRENAGPFVVTAVIVIAALAPMMLAGGVAGTEILYPMAAVVAGGVVSITLFALLVAPNLYLSFAPVVALEMVVARAANGNNPVVTTEALMAPASMGSPMPVHAAND